jgi:hypothetical protein
MKFMLTIRADKNSEAGVPPDPKLLAAIGQLTEEMTKAGVLVDTGGLAPSSQLTRVRAASGKLTKVDGPFAETKEMIAGYAVVQVKSKEEAIAMASRFMQIHADILGPSWEGESEVRQMFGPGDFPH